MVEPKPLDICLLIITDKTKLHNEKRNSKHLHNQSHVMNNQYETMRMGTIQVKGK